MNVYNSTFINNTAIFSQETMKLFFSGLTGLPDIAQVNPEMGGSIFFAGIKLTINQSIFINSTGFLGGALYITKYSIFNIKQDVLITECYFKFNRGHQGGTIGFSNSLNMIDALIVFCVFNGNEAKSKNFIKIIKLIFYEMELA